jgi:hypothetical protein
MKKIFGMSLISILIASDQVFAANIGVITSPPTLLNLVVLGVAIGCLVGSFKLLDVLKGGLLFKSWQIFMFGFAVLAINQLASLLSDLEILGLPDFVGPALWVVASGLFLYGIFQTKKTLD